MISIATQDYSNYQFSLQDNKPLLDLKSIKNGDIIKIQDSSRLIKPS